MAGKGERPRWNEARGLYDARYSFHDDGGVRRQRWVRAKTEKACQLKLDAALGHRDSGVVVDAAKTVGGHLEWWLHEIEGTVAPATHVNYSNIVRLYVAPRLGRRKLAELRPADVSGLVKKLADEGKSGNTQRLARSVLRRALRRAEQEGLIGRNVAAIADGPKVATAEGRTLTVEQARTFRASLRGHHHEAAFVTMLGLGLRRGELLGLSWDDLSLDSAPPVLTVRRALKRLPTGLTLAEPKTKESRRSLVLPAPVVDALHTHRVRQLADEVDVGASWVPRPLGADLVFRTKIGTAVDPDNFRQICYVVSEAAGLGRWSPHELRHSAASILLAEGVPLKVVSETLGHSSIRITSDIYAHLMIDARREAADAMTRALG